MLKNSEKRPITARNRFRIPTEIERWVYSNDLENEVRLGYDPDDFKSIDDSYLDQFDKESTKKKLNKQEQKERIVEILRQVKLSKQLKKTQTETTFNSLLSNIISANSNQPDIAPKLDTTEEKTTVKIKENSKFKSINSGISRAVPGSLQQNITIERTFFKDLLKLSKQRYISKLNIDFQKKRFAANQARKGLYTDIEQTATRSQSVHPQIKNKQMKREYKSISAFAKRRSDSILDTYLKADSKSKNEKNKVKTVKLLDDESSEDDYQELNEKSIPHLKRPNTTLALSNHLSSRLSHTNEIKPNIKNKRDTTHLYLLQNPTHDERFKGLIGSMSNYKPNKEAKKPDLLVRNLINSNKALQLKGDQPKDNEKKASLMEFNMKLFEKLVQNI